MLPESTATGTANPDYQALFGDAAEGERPEEEEEDELDPADDPDEDDDEEGAEEEDEQERKKPNLTKALRESRERERAAKAAAGKLVQELEELKRQKRREERSSDPVEARIQDLEEKLERTQAQALNADQVESGKILPQLFEDDDLKELLDAGVKSGKYGSYAEGAALLKRKFYKDAPAKDERPRKDPTRASTSVRSSGNDPKDASLQRRMRSDNRQVRERAIAQDLGLL